MLIYYATSYAKHAIIPDMPAPRTTTTVSSHFLHAMLRYVRTHHGEALVRQVTADAGIPLLLLDQPAARVTREQFVLLYKSIAFALDDEMLGLWSRPIRGGTLKYMMLSLLDAPTILIALNRFVRFWNLILDDYKLQMSRRQGDSVRVALLPRKSGADITLLGHELMMKLIHGIVSWLLGREIPIQRVDFVFARPAHASDYVFLYPGEVHFSAAETAIYLHDTHCQSPFKRERHQLWTFLKRAPEDWTFTTFHRGSITAKAREYLERRIDQPVTIQELADALHVSVRTLNRKFAAERTQFQAVKDAVRRDIAVHRLSTSDAPIAAVAGDLGFANAAVFCRAFKQWTGSTPTAYRKGARG